MSIRDKVAVNSNRIKYQNGGFNSPRSGFVEEYESLGLGCQKRDPSGGLPPFSEKRAKISEGARAEVAIGLGVKGRAILLHLPLLSLLPVGNPFMKCCF